MKWRDTLYITRPGEYSAETRKTKTTRRDGTNLLTDESHPTDNEILTERRGYKLPVAGCQTALTGGVQLSERNSIVIC